jgi:hypothetical protein
VRGGEERREERRERRERRVRRTRGTEQGCIQSSHGLDDNRGGIESNSTTSTNSLVLTLSAFFYRISGSQVAQQEDEKKGKKMKGAERG